MNKSLLVLIVILSSFSAHAKTSGENRNGKKLEITLQSGVDYRMSPTQVSAMYFINQDNMIGVKSGTDRTTHERQTNFALQYKHYGSNSFFVAGELFYLNTREEVNGLWGDLFDQQEYAEHSSLGAGIRIGNQWTWKYVTVGCDWIGIGQRFGTFKKETSKLNDTTLTLLNIIIGTSF